MGRARGQLQAIAVGGFDALVGVRRGVEHGTVLSRTPTQADRLELQRLAGPVDRGDLEAAITLLMEHQYDIARFPLLAELHERVCERLVSAGKRRFFEGSARAVRAFGFEPELDRGQILSTEELQAKLDTALIDQAKERTRNLFKVGVRPSEDIVAEAAYMKEFCRLAAAQCFKERERLCQEFLSGPVPPNLREVSAWRELIKSIVGRPDADVSKAGVAALMRRTKTTVKRAPEQFRRRQRYLR